MKVREVFKEPIDRHIAPVVYFHEQELTRLADEVSQYIFTPGIHDEMTRLLGNIAKALGNPEACDHPAAWISGFFGSGKSSFAKLLGLSLDQDRKLPDGRQLSEALLDRDDTPDRQKLRDNWDKLTSGLPYGALSVVFDIGAEARDNEHVDKAALRCLRRALGYCSKDPVAVEEMKLEKAGLWEQFEAKALEVLRRPWKEASEEAFAMEDFSEVVHHLFPSKYTEPMAWHYSHTGRAYDARGSVQDSIQELKQILGGRARDRHLFFVIDEVSQYVVRPGAHIEKPVADTEPAQDSKDRMLRLQSFVSAIGKEFRGRVWLFALGQEQLDHAEKDSPLWKLRARFPEPYRVHLDAANIRDVVKRRLLRKNDAAETTLRAAWRTHESRLKLYAWRGETATEADFLDTYPLMPGHVEILLETGSGLRAQSPRVQADAASVRGLLQLVQEVFRNSEVRLADAEVPTLLTFDQVYEVQRSGLPNDKSLTMQAIFNTFPLTADPKNTLMCRVAKVVCLMGYQERVKVDEQKVAQLLYGTPGAPSLEEDVRSALKALKDENFLSFSETKGYRLQDAAGKEWESERKSKPSGAESVAERILEQVQDLFTFRPNLGGRALPLELIFTAPPKYQEHRPKTVRDETTVPLDLRFTVDANDTGAWTHKSTNSPCTDRFLWIVPYAIGDDLFELAAELCRSRAMTSHYGRIRSTLLPEKLHLLIDEETRSERLSNDLKDRVKARLHEGSLLFRGQRAPLTTLGSVEAVIRTHVEPRLRDLYPYHLDVAVTPKDMEQLMAREVPAGASQKFFQGPGNLGLLKMDAGCPDWAPDGEAPQAVLRQIKDQRGINGGTLLQTLARPPYGYPGDIVRACVLALLRAKRILVTTDSGRRLTSYKDEGARDLFLTDRALRNAEMAVYAGGPVGDREKVAIRQVLELAGEKALTLDPDLLTDAIFRVVSAQRQRLREVEERLRSIPVVGEPVHPELFTQLAAACERCSRDRRVEATLEAFHQDIEVFRSGFSLLKEYQRDLTDDAIRAVKDAHNAWSIEGDQLNKVKVLDEPSEAAMKKLRVHLSGSRPWRDYADLATLVSTLRAAYANIRAARSSLRESEASNARELIKREAGVDTLKPEVATEVLVPLVLAGSSVDVDAVAPSIATLDAEWEEVLRKADTDARERLHRALHPRIPVQDVTIPAKVLKTPADVETWITNLRNTLLAELGTEGRRHVRVKGS